MTGALDGDGWNSCHVKASPAGRELNGRNVREEGAYSLFGVD